MIYVIFHTYIYIKNININFCLRAFILAQTVPCTPLFERTVLERCCRHGTDCQAQLNLPVTSPREAPPATPYEGVATLRTEQDAKI